MPAVLDLATPSDMHKLRQMPALLPIATFFATHPGLLEVVNEGIHRLYQAFPGRPGFRLALKADPEIADWEYLVVSVKTALPVAEAHTGLNTFLDAWWLEHIAQFGDVLLFNVEYM